MYVPYHVYYTVCPPRPAASCSNTAARCASVPQSGLQSNARCCFCPQHSSLHHHIFRFQRPWNEFPHNVLVKLAVRVIFRGAAGAMSRLVHSHTCAATALVNLSRRLPLSIRARVVTAPDGLGVRQARGLLTFAPRGSCGALGSEHCASDDAQPTAAPDTAGAGVCARPIRLRTL